MTSKSIVLISDAHVASGAPNEAEFKAMLENIAHTDFDLLFLGDIMDLWIAKDGYEDDLHRWFVAWCRREKEHRSIIYVEGNHEFFVVDRYDGDIGTVRKTRYQNDMLVAEHGHNILGRTIGFNRLFIAFCKSRFANFVLKIVPFGQKLVLWLKKSFGSNGRTLFNGLPDDILCSWANTVSAETACKNVFIGHFHSFREFDLPNGGKFRILPAWKIDQKVVLYEPDSHRAYLCDWRELSST